jgi:hypothetical protein
MPLPPGAHTRQAGSGIFFNVIIQLFIYLSNRHRRHIFLFHFFVFLLNTARSSPHPATPKWPNLSCRSPPVCDPLGCPTFIMTYLFHFFNLSFYTNLKETCLTPGFWASKALHAVVELGVADAIHNRVHEGLCLLSRK